LAALLTPTIAIAGAYIAWQQWRTNRNKLKLDLFERRYALYDAAAKLLGSIMGSGKATDKATYEFLVATKGAKFIAGREIARYFDDELYKKAIDLQALHSELEGLEGEERKRNIEKQRELKNWFQDQYRVLDHKFDPLMGLRH
jgi:hypothetical protein